MLGRVAIVLNRVSERYFPSALGIAVALVFVTVFLACGWGFHESPILARPILCIKSFWGGLSGLLAFAMQMCLVVLTGTIVAQSPPFKRALETLASVPQSPRQAVAWMAFVSMALGLLNWGVSIVGSAVLSRAIVRKQRGVDYRLLVASAYLGLGCTWHAGLSASAPMTVAAAKNDFVQGGFLQDFIPISETIGSAFNLSLVAVVVVLMVVLSAWLHPKSTVTGTELVFPEDETPRLERPHWVDSSRFVPTVLALSAFAYMWFLVREKSFRALDINTVNVAFLALGLLLHGSLRSFSAAAIQGAQSLHGIVIQFPLYAGMGALIKDSGLASRIADVFVNHANAKTFPLLVYWYSGLVNYFVPSGGSKFAIEAPYLFPAGAELGVAPAHTLLSYAWGDMMTDLIQPFWAIPLLGVARLEFRDIAGYCMILCLVYATLVSAAFAIGFG